MINKEQQELLDEAYNDYLKNFTPPKYPPNWDVQPDYYEPMSKEVFIYGIKIDKGFSQKWGLKIEEQELSLDERVNIFNSKMLNEGIRTQIATVGVSEEYWRKSLEQTKHNIPTKLITVTYNDKTIESYE